MSQKNSLYILCCSDNSGTNLIKVYAALREITMKEKTEENKKEQATIEIMNVDISRIMEETISFFEERDNFELAAKLRGKTPGVDILTDDLDSELAIVLK
jgi:hypothetical protein